MTAGSHPHAGTAVEFKDLQEGRNKSQSAQMKDVGLFSEECREIMGIVSHNVGFNLNWIPFGTMQSATTLTSCREAALAWGRHSAASKMCLAESKS